MYSFRLFLSLSRRSSQRRRRRTRPSPRARRASPVLSHRPLFCLAYVFRVVSFVFSPSHTLQPHSHSHAPNHSRLVSSRFASPTAVSTVSPLSSLSSRSSRRSKFDLFSLDNRIAHYISLPAAPAPSRPALRITHAHNTVRPRSFCSAPAPAHPIVDVRACYLMTLIHHVYASRSRSRSPTPRPSRARSTFGLGALALGSPTLLPLLMDGLERHRAPGERAERSKRADA